MARRGVRRPRGLGRPGGSRPAAWRSCGWRPRTCDSMRRCAPGTTSRCWPRSAHGWPRRRCGSGGGRCWPRPSTRPGGRAMRCGPLHEARRVLVDELGIDPGPDLVALEQAILRQDPALVAASALPEPSTTCPYLGLVPYDVADADGFFGRDGEVEACLSRLSAVGVLAVVGPSGSGKSSLVRAGVAASLQRNGRRVVVVTPGARPMEALTRAAVVGSGAGAGGRPVRGGGHRCATTRRRRPRSSPPSPRTPNAARWSSPCAPTASASCRPTRDFARLVEPGLHLLSAMSEADLRAAIEGPARQVGLLLEPGLVDLLVREVAGRARSAAVAVARIARDVAAARGSHAHRRRLPGHRRDPRRGRPVGRGGLQPGTRRTATAAARPAPAPGDPHPGGRTGAQPRPPPHRRHRRRARTARRAAGATPGW